ncbi:Aromatic acid exporter family member 1 [Pilibacter termitis]|jgi:uncharacterized membrane protein YgaE (UPF0421/DUF939 family)|uniref:Aromatic acid exporter family member 1 n=1 Tax=Pilibacter termitis TaxID=263852 RepID=A0A1T4N7N7_9ENTE|nr:aromatic acid exporter family protein [Pilibacter termitis]SJZ75300.1 Aromatic acid exporter family member 1 [Pilibacter termitis]
MQIGNFRLGMRTVKTGVAVFFCILLFGLLQRGNPMIACIAAVFSLRQDFTTSVSFGKSRIIGNTVGGACAVLYFLIAEHFQRHFLVQLFILPFFIVVCISFSNGIKNNAGIIASVATLLMISLNIPENETISYAFQRVLDTFIGTFIAILMNITMREKAEQEEISLEHDIERLQMEEEKLRKLRETFIEKNNK